MITNISFSISANLTPNATHDVAVLMRLPVEGGAVLDTIPCLSV